MRLAKPERVRPVDDGIDNFRVVVVGNLELIDIVVDVMLLSPEAL